MNKYPVFLLFLLFLHLKCVHTCRGDSVQNLLCDGTLEDNCNWIGSNCVICAPFDNPGAGVGRPQCSCHYCKNPVSLIKCKKY